MRASLSVVIPLYNHDGFVARAIDSVLAQSRPPDEVLVVDDASTDDGVAVVERIALKDSRVRLIRSENNQGMARTTNQGFWAARGDYLYGLSADDCVLPGFFERALAAFEKCPRAGIAYGDFLTVTQGLEILERTPSLPPVDAFYTPDELSHQLYGDIIETRGAIFQRDALLACGGYVPELEEMSDWYLGLAVAFRYGLYYLPGTCHVKRVDFSSYGLKLQVCREGQEAKIRQIIQHLRRPENADLLPHFARSAAFLHFGVNAAEAILKVPECWDSVHTMLLQEPLGEYMRRKRERVRKEGRTRNRPHFSRPATWQKYVIQYTPEFLRPRVDALVRDWNREGRRVLIYGAGEHTVALFKLTSLHDAQIVGIADRSRALQGQRQWGFKVMAPQEIAARKPDVVLISSAANQDSIYLELAELADHGIEVVRLYEEEGEKGEKGERPAAARPVDVSARLSLKSNPILLSPEWLVPRVSQLVASWNRRKCRVVLYGAGEITSSLFRWTNIADADLVAIAEPVDFILGERLWNLQTVSPFAIDGLDADAILICDNDQSGEIRRGLAKCERKGFEIVNLQASKKQGHSTELSTPTPGG